MEQFRQIITLLLENKTSIEQTQQALAALVLREPQMADEFVRLLNQLYSNKHLDPQRYSMLRTSIVSPEKIGGSAAVTQGPTAGPQTGQAPVATSEGGESVEPEDDEEDDGAKTQFRVAKPASEESSDKTAFRPRQATDVSAQNRSPTEGSPLTGSTSASMSGLFGGTGSNWSSPSAWTGAGSGESQVNVGSVLKDRFVLRELIGKGGMGMVFKALDVRKEEANDRNPYVAIKVLNEDFKQHKDSLKALQREARKAQQLTHPNIVNVHDFDRDGSNVFMNMELLEGVPLDKLIRKHKGRGLSWSEALPMIQGMSLALEHAHAKNIIHSDFKPGNCFLTNDGVVKVFDFGIARAAKRTGELRGEETKFDAGTLGALTPAYATCEMIDGDEPDKRDDIYALACTIYELLAGKHPYNKLSASEAAEKGLVPKPIAKLSRSRNKALLRGLALKRSKRTPSAYNLLQEINPRLSKQLLRVGLPAATLLVLVVTGLIVGSITYKKRQIEHIGARLSGGQFTEVEQAMVELRELDTTDQRGLLTEYRNELTKQYEDEVIRSFAPSKQLYDYPRAQQLLVDVEKIFPDSSRIQSLKELIEKDRQDIQVQKADEYERFLDNGDLLPVDGNDIYDVLNVVAQIDSNDALLSDQRLPQALEQAARDAVGREDFTAAEDYLAAGFEMSPDDSALINVRDALNSARNAIDRAEEIARLQKNLEPLTSDIANLGDFSGGTAQRNFEQLQTVQPSDPMLVRVRQVAERKAVFEIDKLVEARQWSEAQDQLENLGPLASAEFTETQLAVIERQKDVFESRLADLNSEIDSVIAERKLDSTSNTRAEALLSRLAGAGASELMVAAARDRVALGFIDSARTARSTNQWEQARELAARATSLNPGEEVQTALNEEIVKIGNQETLAAQELLAQEVETLQRRFQERLESTAFDSAVIVAARSTLAELEKTYGDVSGVANFVSGGKEDVRRRTNSEALAMAEKADWTGANTLLRTAEAEFGPSPDLADTRNRVSSLRQEQASAQLKAQIATQESEVGQLLEDSTLDDNWLAQFQRELDSLEDLDSGSRFGADARVSAAKRLLSDAREQRENSRWVKAEQQLNRARILAPDLADITLETDNLEAALSEYNQQAEQNRRTADVMALRVQFERQVEARRLDNAEQSLAKLTNMVGADDPFVRDEAPKALVDQRLQVAAAMAARLSLTNAIKQLDSAEKYAPQDERIVSAKRIYQDQISVYSIVGSNNVQRISQLPTIFGRLESSMSEFGSFQSAMQTRLRGRIEALALTDRASAERVFEASKVAFTNLAVSWPQVEIPKRETVVNDGADRPSEGGSGVRVDPPPPPRTVTRGKSCKSSYAGGGKITRNTCYDFLDANRTAGPSLVVVSGVNGGSEFAISRSEITRIDFNRYCQSTGQCTNLGGAGRLPATSLSPAQMEAYAAWLSSTTGFTYTLPTVEQWQHAASANGSTLSSNMNCKLNVGGSQTRGLKLESTATGQNDANAWGLWHVVGNAEEAVRQGGAYLASGGAYSDSINDCQPFFTRPFQGPQERTGFRVVRNVR